MKNAPSRLGLRVFAYIIAGSAFLAMLTIPGMTVSSSTARRGVAVHAAGRGNPRINLQNGYELPTSYVGKQRLVESLKSGSARALSLAAGDFDEDGQLDLVSGYSEGPGGAISLSIGNRETLSRPSVGSDAKSPGLFLSTSRVYPVPANPNFLAAGDFDGDGHADVIAAARGGQSLYLLRGDGRGALAPSQSIGLPGQVTAMAAGQLDSGDSSSVVAGITGPGGPQLLLYRGGQLMTYPVPGEISAIAFGLLAEDGGIGLAVATARQVLVVPGRDLASGDTARLQGDLQAVSLPSEVEGLAVGDFISGGSQSISVQLRDGTVHLLARVPQQGKAGQQNATSSWSNVGSGRIAKPVAPAGPTRSILTAARLSGGATDELVVADYGKNSLQILSGDASAEPGASKLQIVGSLDVESTPVATLAVKSNSRSQSALVVLREGEVWPAVVMPAAPGSAASVDSRSGAGAVTPQSAALIPMSAPTNVIYDSIPAPLPGNVPSLGYQATQTSEFGDLIQFAGTARKLSTVTLVMSDWALASDWPSFNMGGSWNHPITLTLYNVNNSGANPAPGTQIAQRTGTFSIQFRPPATPNPCGTAWLSSDGHCYNGLALTVTFDFTGTTVPNQIIYGVAFNTLTWGYNPIGVDGPYESLNFGLAQVPPTVGTNPFPDSAYWNTATAGNYSDGGTGGVGVFRRDTAWTPFSGAVTFRAVEALDMCLKDNNLNDFIQWNSSTGDYVFTHCGTNGFTLSGTGQVGFANGIRSLTDKKPDRNISAGFNTASLTGSANVVVIPSPGLFVTYRITDTNPHATCNCGANIGN
ncbi:MAG TPA: VCBS repeat-containing protein [Blastocatellia bacterium]|nr:VCBS repeat-containing protein [Blastocatellia bacterium]